MKKIVGLFCVLMLFPLQAFSQALWVEGEHYKVLSGRQAQSKQVTEFFSFWCPHCYSFERIAHQIEKALPDDVPFNKVHVNFMRSTTPEIQNEATKAMLIGRALGQEKQLNEAIFKYIHVQKAPISSLDDIKRLFVVAGVDEKQFDNLATGPSSFGLNNLLGKNNAIVQEFRSDVRSVPSFIVNGKYLAQMKSGMTPDDFVELVVWLTQLK